jgi:hypothetical protein
MIQVNSRKPMRLHRSVIPVKLWIRRSVLLPTLLISSTAKASAQEQAALAEVYDYTVDGMHAFDADRPAEALSKFAAAYAIMKLPAIALFMARAEAKLGHLVAAMDLCDQALQLENGVGDAEVQQKAREEAKAERDALAQRIPRLVANVSGIAEETVIFRIDTVPVAPSALRAGFPVDPGKHSLSAQSGNQKKEIEIALLERDTKTISFNFELPPPPFSPSTKVRVPEALLPEQSPMRTAGWVSLGIGGAALAMWGTTGLWALAKSRELDKGQPWGVDNCANASNEGNCNDYRHLRTVSSIGFYTGLVGVATGTTLLILAREGTPKPRGSVRKLDASFGLGSFELQGTF